MFVILVYDVNTKRVNRIHKICQKYLTWVQNSVFEGNITQANLMRLKHELGDIIDKEYDSIIIYEFRTKAYFQRETLGKSKPDSEEFII